MRDMISRMRRKGNLILPVVDLKKLNLLVKNAMRLLMHLEGHMDTNIIRISIAGIFCFAMHANAEQIDVASVLPFGGPKAIFLDGPIRIYDKSVGTAKCCIGNEYTEQTRLNYYSQFSKIDLMCAVQLSWHFLRYRIAPRRKPIRENCQGVLTDPYRRFPAKEPTLFRVDGVVSTNIVMRILSRVMIG